VNGLPASPSGKKISDNITAANCNHFLLRYGAVNLLTLGRGSAFAVYLPVLETTKTAETQANAELIPGGNERILFVDDEEAIISLSRKQLISLGYDVTAATSRREALKLFAASQAIKKGAAQMAAPFFIACRAF